MTVQVDLRAVAALKSGLGMRSALLQAGQQVAVAAAQLAPKRTGPGGGAGARSIRAELVTVNGLPEVHVSWDRSHYYMGFQEFGTEHQRATPFLRPAAGQFQ